MHDAEKEEGRRSDERSGGGNGTEGRPCTGEETITHAPEGDSVERGEGAMGGSEEESDGNRGAVYFIETSDGAFVKTALEETQMERSLEKLALPTKEMAMRDGDQNATICWRLPSGYFVALWQGEEVPAGSYVVATRDPLPENSPYSISYLVRSRDPWKVNPARS